MRVETSTFLNGHWDLHCGPHAYPTSPHMHLVFFESPLLCAGLLLPWVLDTVLWPRQIILLYHVCDQSIYLVHMSASIYSFLSLSRLSSSVSAVYLYGTNFYAFIACESIISISICDPNDHLFMIHHVSIYWLASKHHGEKTRGSVHVIRVNVFNGDTRP